MSACRRWNEKQTIEKLGPISNFTLQPPTVNTRKCRENQLPQLATNPDRGIVAALTKANARLAKQLEDNSNELRELKALLNKECSEKRGQRSFNPSHTNYCWTHGFKVGSTHMSLTFKIPKPGHKKEAT
jgi:hypothetical protein